MFDKFNKLHKDNINQWLGIQIPAGGELDPDAEKVMMHQIRLGNLEVLAGLEDSTWIVYLRNTDYWIHTCLTADGARAYINKITKTK